MALEARDPSLTIRPDSQLCRDYINGCSKMTLEEVVDATEEIAFFYRKTEYSSILRYLRSRDIEFENSDDFEEDEYEECEKQREMNEACRRMSAKEKALNKWLYQKRKEKDDAWKNELPKTIRSAKFNL